MVRRSDQQSLVIWTTLLCIKSSFSRYTGISLCYVISEIGTGVCVQLEECLMVESSLLQPKCQTSGSAKKLY